MIRWREPAWRDPDADARARALLLDHLTPAERREWEVEGRITVLKRGVVWPLLVRHLVVAAVLALGLAVPGVRIFSALLLPMLTIGLLPIWLPGFVIACSRRRTWVLSPWASPELRTRRKRFSFCVRLVEELPGPDRVLAWKNLLEANEAYFLRTANVRAPGP